MRVFYSIGHRKGERIFARSGGPRLAKRRKLTTVNPWKGYIISYLEKRWISRTSDSTRFHPTDKEVEIASILLVAACFVQTRQRQIAERCCQGSEILNQTL